jgi:hypothetical protein
MGIIKRARVPVWLAVLGAAAVGWAGAAKADSPVPTPQEAIVVVDGTEVALNCNEATPQRARWLADKALRDGAYQRAGECYLIAGEHAMADQAFIKASAQARADTSRKLAANLNDVKAQARQMKEAFRHR